jgi:hypothetical protein
MTITRERYLFPWMVPGKLAVRLAQRVRRAPPRLPTIPPEPLNGFLRTIGLFQERVNAVLRLPFGGSLMVTGSAPMGTGAGAYLWP